MPIVQDIMTRSVVVIRSSATVEDAIWLMRAKRVRSLIVKKTYAGGPYGIVTEKDIVYGVTALGKDPVKVFVGSLMRRPCVQLPPYFTVQEAAQTLAQAGIYRAPVVKDNQLLGVISVTDILRKGSLPTPARDELSKSIQEALQKARIIDDEETRIQQECDLAWQIYEDIQDRYHQKTDAKAASVNAE